MCSINLLSQVLKSTEVSEPANVKKKTSAKKSDSKASKKIYSEGSSDSLNSESEDIEDERKSKKKVAPKKKILKSEEPRKHKRPVKEIKESSKKRAKLAEASEENSDAEAGRSASEDDQSQSSAEKPAKVIHHFLTSIIYCVCRNLFTCDSSFLGRQAKEVATPAYGKRVEHLKSVIKSCGMRSSFACHLPAWIFVYGGVLTCFSTFSAAFLQ